MNAHVKLNRDALNDAVQDHLHPALTNSLLVADWIGRAIRKTTFQFGNHDARQILAYARENLREALAELDAFEAAVYPAAIIPTDSTFTDEARPYEVVT